MHKLLLIFSKIFLFVLSINFIVPSIVMAGELEIYCPEVELVKKVQLKNKEVAELTIHLKSFGDPVSNFAVMLFDDDGREVGRSVSDDSGILKFLEIPAGRFRINVERKLNNRGGDSTVNVGDFYMNVIAPDGEMTADQKSKEHKNEHKKSK